MKPPMPDAPLTKLGLHQGPVVGEPVPARPKSENASDLPFDIQKVIAEAKLKQASQAGTLTQEQAIAQAKRNMWEETMEKRKKQRALKFDNAYKAKAKSKRKMAKKARRAARKKT